MDLGLTCTVGKTNSTLSLKLNMCVCTYACDRTETTVKFFNMNNFQSSHLNA